MHKHHLLASIALFLIAMCIQAQTLQSIKGTITDAQTTSAIPYAHLQIQNTSIGTISNEDGVFLLKVNSKQLGDSLLVSFMGYETQTFLIEEKLFSKPLNISLTNAAINLEGITVRAGSALDFLEEAITKLPENRNNKPVQQQAFLRESFSENGKYFSVSEAVLDIYKHSIVVNDKVTDRSQIRRLKGRSGKNLDEPEMKMIADAKVNGSVNALVNDSDMVWSLPFFFRENQFEYYQYDFGEITTFKNQLVQKIKVQANPKHYKKAFYEGIIYIDLNDLAIVRVEYNSIEAARKKILKKSIRGIGKIMLRTMGYKFHYFDERFVIDYQKYEGKWYQDYCKFIMDAKVTYKQDVYMLQINGELLITKTNTRNAKPIPEEERISNNQTLAKELGDYDPRFWGNYNYLPPTESLKNY